MANDNPRHERVGNQLQRELAELLRTHIKDPRVQWVSINDVRVTKDLGVAKIYYSVLTGDGEELQHLLNRYSGKLRGILGKRMNIRQIPELRFTFDNLAEEAGRLSSLIDQAVKEDKAHAENRGDDNEE